MSLKELAKEFGGPAENHEDTIDPSETKKQVELLTKHVKTIGLLMQKPKCDLGAVDSNNGWRQISLAVDSGACVTVASPEDIPNYPVTETEQSKAGETFAAASGDAIPNLGNMAVPIVTKEKTERLMSVTAAPVLKPSMSVQQLNKTGHTVVFDESASFLCNKNMGEVNLLREDAGNFMMDCWIPPNASGLGGVHTLSAGWSKANYHRLTRRGAVRLGSIWGRRRRW